jgi:hypothetical protein
MRLAAFSPARCLKSRPSLAAPRTVAWLPVALSLVVTMTTAGFIFVGPEPIIPTTRTSPWAAPGACSTWAVFPIASNALPEHRRHQGDCYRKQASATGPASCRVQLEGAVPTSGWAQAGNLAKPVPPEGHEQPAHQHAHP